MVTQFPLQRLAAVLLLAVGIADGERAVAQVTVRPASLRPIGQVGERYLSYNVEAVEVTGGRFWKPYKSVNGSDPDKKNEPGANQPAEMAGSLFQQRPPIDLSNPRLRMFASALSPAYIRVSGTWRNSTFFQDNDEAALSSVPDGFKGVMTRAQWKGVIDFAHAVNAQIVASVATSRGTRDKDGVWTADQARSFFDYTKAIGGHIAASEFMNEPTFALVGGAPSNYNAEAFGRDVKLFEQFLRKASPDTVFLGPGSIGEGAPLIEGAPAPKMISTEAMLKASGPIFDAFSYHYYATISKRCTGAMGPKVGTTSDQALSLPFLEKNLTVEQYYAGLRDRYLPGKAVWNTETGEAGCGGDPWAAKFLDTFRFLDELGVLAQKSVQTVMVNTLASSDYGLLDEETLDLRPDYWAAVLWKRFMGRRVLDAGPSPDTNMRIYAQCTPGHGGAVSLLVLNLDKAKSKSLKVAEAGLRSTLTADGMMSSTVSLNGAELHAAADGTLPSLGTQRFRTGPLQFAPLTITFLEFPAAKNAACHE